VLLAMLPCAGSLPARMSPLPACFVPVWHCGGAGTGHRDGTCPTGPGPVSGWFGARACSPRARSAAWRASADTAEGGQADAHLVLNGPDGSHRFPLRPRAKRESRAVGRGSATGADLDPNAVRTARSRAERKSGKYVCELCNCAFGKLKNFEQHVEGKQHRTNAAAVDDIWSRFKSCARIWLSAEEGAAEGSEDIDEEGVRSYSVAGQTLGLMDIVKAFNAEELQAFPMRASGDGCMSPATRFQDLSLYMRARLLKYVSELMPYYPELPTIVVQMSATNPQHLRVKELFESFEAFKLLENFIVAAKKHRQIDRIYDVACGHGLVGMLLAYRFPAMQVVAVDVAVRPALAAWQAAFEQHGDKLDEWNVPLENFGFANCGVEELGSAGRVDARSLIVSVHGCNEVNRIAIESAISADGLWATLPCCVPEHLYLPKASIKLSDDLNDNVRHDFMCGVMAERYGAQYIAQIDRCITNRAIMIAGGVRELDSQSDGTIVGATKLVGFSRRIMKVSGAFAYGDPAE